MALTKATYSMIQGMSVNVQDYGALGDGVADDTAAIQDALDAVSQYGSVYFPAGNYIISNELILNVDDVLIYGYATITAKAAAQFEFMMKGTGRTGVTVRDLTFDANKDNRKATATVRYMGLGFSGSTECRIINVKATGCRGYNGVSGVALVTAGQSVRCRIEGCIITDCGDAGNSPATDADAIFTSGTQNVITDCIAHNCTDTGFVIESSNQSVISACSANLCGAGAGITSANANDRSGNIINGLTIKNWKGSVGAIQIGVPGGYAGNLLNSSVSNVVIEADTPTYGGPGPALLVTASGMGKAIGVTISNVRIDGAATQGIIVIEGEGINIRDCYVANVTDACIDIRSGTKNTVSNCYLANGSFGVRSSSSANVYTNSNVVFGTGYAVFAEDTSTITSNFDIIQTTTIGRYSKDSGATLNLVSAFNNQLLVNNPVGSAPSGSLTNKFVVVDKTGNPIGYVPIYNA